MNDVGRYIRDQRFALNLYQRDIANAVGCSEQVISRIESGESDSAFSLVSAILILLRKAGAPKFDIYSDLPDLLRKRKIREDWPSQSEGEQS